MTYQSVTNFKEKARDIPVFRKVDVLVIGGGPAGIGAAVAAARNGAGVMLVERNSFVGGTAAAGFVNQFRQMYHISGIPQEVVKRLGKTGGTDPEAWRGYYNSAAFDLEELKFVYEDMLEEAGVKVLMNTWGVDVILENQEVKGVIIENKSGRQAILADVVIDASGDADIAARAGAPFFSQEDNKRLPFTLGLRLGGLNYQKIAEYARNNPQEFVSGSGFTAGKDLDGYVNNAMSGWRSLVKAAKARGELPNLLSRFTLEGINPLALRRGTGYIYGIQSLKRNPVDAEDMTRAELETRKKARQFLKFLKQVPGFESSFLIDFAKNIGVIDSRLIIGDYVLTEEDVFQSRTHEDDIALIVLVQPKGGWEKRHPPDGSEGSDDNRKMLQKLPVYLACFGIPFRCLLPQRVDRLLVPGRNFSSTYDVMFAGRQMFECIATGEASGVAAAMASKQKITPRHLDVMALRKQLVSQGVRFNRDDVDLNRVRKMYSDRGFQLSEYGQYED